MTGSHNLSVGLVQMAMSPDPADNLKRAAAAVEQLAKDGADVICLPELFRSQYFCQLEDERYFDLAEAIPGPTTEALGDTAHVYLPTIIAPVFERRAPGIYHNSVVMLNDANAEHRVHYRKMHIPDDPGFFEKYYFTPGDLGFQSFTHYGGLGETKIGALICWDQWFPEAARLMALQGAQVLFYPTAIGWQPGEKGGVGLAQHDAWRTMQRSHAIANGVFVAAVNRVGIEKPKGSGGIEFWGQSFVCDPFGRVLAELSADKEETVIVKLDLSLIEATRRTWPFLRDRRIDAYQGLTQRYLDSAE